MPELPEVEILARHLRPLLCGKTIRNVAVQREKVLRPTSFKKLRETLSGAKFMDLTRRGKYLLFTLQARKTRETIRLLGHLGMTGRMFLAPKDLPLPKHAAVILDLGALNFVYEDFRYFGRMTLDLSPIENLGLEPLEQHFSAKVLAANLQHSSQPIKVKLLDQNVVAGIGNIYASEALFRAKISPRLSSKELNLTQTKKLWRAIRDVLNEAIKFGSTVQLKFADGKSDGLFYFGRAENAPDFYEERLRVYGRAGKPCLHCGQPIRRFTQAARSTFYCPRCQID